MAVAPFRSPRRILLIVTAAAGIAGLLAVGWYVGSSGQKADDPPFQVNGNAIAAPVQLLASLPAEKYPKPGPEGQPHRDAANEWLRTNVAGTTIDVPLVVEHVHINDRPDGFCDVNLIVTIDPKLDDAVSLGEGPWGGEFEFAGIPYYIELWGLDPLWTRMSRLDADRLAEQLSGKNIDFRCRINDFEVQEGDDPTSLKLVVTFAEVLPPADEASPSASPVTEPAAPRLAARERAETPEVDAGAASQPAEPPAPAQPTTFTSAGTAGVLARPDANSILDVAWAPDGRQLAAFDNAGLATLWDVASRRGRDISPTNEMAESAGELWERRRHVVFSADGRTLVVGTAWKIAVIDLPAGRIRWETGDEFKQGSLAVDPGVTHVGVLTPDPEDNFAPALSVREIAKGKEVFRGPPMDKNWPMALGPGAKLLAMESSFDGKIRLFDIPARKELPGMAGVVGSSEMEFSADGKRLILPDANGESQIWDVSDPARPRLAKRIPIEQDGVLGKLRKDHRLAVQSKDGGTVASWVPDSDTVTLLDAASGAAQGTLHSGSQGKSPSPISSVALTADGSRIAMGTVEGMIVVPGGGVKVRSVSPLAALKFTPPTSKGKFHNAGSAPEIAWFSPDGKWLITAGKAATVWNLEARRQHMLPMVRDRREEIVNRPVLSRAQQFDFRNPNSPSAAQWNAGPYLLMVQGGFFRPDGKTLTLTGQGFIWHYDLLAGTHRGDFSDPMTPAARPSPDGRYAATWFVRPVDGDIKSGYRAELVILDAESAKTVKSLGIHAFHTGISHVGWAHHNTFHKLAFSADNRIFAAEVNEPRPGNPDNMRIRVWNWQSGQELSTTAEAPIDALDLVDGGRLLVTVGQAYGARGDTEHALFFDVETGAQQHKIDLTLGHAVLVSARAFTAVERVFATADEHGMLLVRDLVSGAERARVQAHDKKISAIAFSGNGKLLATCATDSEVKVWRLSDLLTGG